MQQPSLTRKDNNQLASIDGNKPFWLSLLFTFLSCGFEFRNDVGTGLDSSWMRIMADSFYYHWVYGRELIFTYGPLATLDTRFAEYNITTPLLLLGDLLIFAGYFYLLYKYMPWKKGWPLLLFVATIAFRWCHFGQSSHLLFTCYASIILLNKTTDRLSIVFCALYAALCFYVKVNYGIVALFFVTILSILQLIQRRQYAFYLPVLTTLFLAGVWSFVDIDIINYIKYSIHIIKDYEESVYVAIDINGSPYKHAMYILLITFCLLLYKMYSAIKKKDNLANTGLFTVLIAGMSYMLYKSSFVRYDISHYRHIFASFPIFFIFICSITGYSSQRVTRALAAIVVLLSVWIIPGENAKFRNLSVGDLIDNIVLDTYYKQITEQFVPASHPEALFRAGITTRIGKATVDIFPHDVSYLFINQLNYRPRPVPQSYTVYNGALDSLNANHFISKRRPEYIMMYNGGIDNRYFFWDESLTMATIHLNYTITDSACACTLHEPYDFMVMRVEKNKHAFPNIKQIEEQTVKFGDTVWVQQNSEFPLYMSADIEYTLLGRINKMLLQPTPIEIKLITENESKGYRLIIPIVKHPVLISHTVNNTKELHNFIAGDIDNNQKIKAFVISTTNKEVNPEIAIKFYQYLNY